MRRWAPAALLCVLLQASGAMADAGPRPRAAVVVDVGEGVDPFIVAYLFEVAATVLRSANTTSPRPTRPASSCGWRSGAREPARRMTRASRRWHAPSTRPR